MLRYTAQITDLNLAHPYGDQVHHFATKTELLNAWTAGYFNTVDCTKYWGGELPAMSDCFTVTVWRGVYDDISDLYPDAEIVLGRQRRGVWHPFA